MLEICIQFCFSPSFLLFFIIRSSHNSGLSFEQIFSFTQFQIKRERRKYMYIKSNIQKIARKNLLSIFIIKL